MIPSDALASDQTITLTPVTAINGMPLSGGLSGAVHFEPDGLSLLEPATLDILFTSPVDTTDAISFQYIGNGSDCFLVPGTINGSTVSLAINHFSGAGKGRGNAADRAKASSYVPASAEDQFYQDLENLFSKTGKEGRSPTDDEYQVIAGKWHASIRMRLFGAATAADADFPCVVAEFLRWVRVIDALSNGLRSRFTSEINGSVDLIIQGYTYAVNQSYGRCKNKQGPI